MKRIIKNFAKASAHKLSQTFGRIVTADREVYHVPSDISFECFRDLARGIYETHEKYLLWRHFMDASTIVDLGANIGVVGRAAMAKLDTDGTYIAVEPNPSSLKALEKNLRSGSTRYTGLFLGRIAVVNAAIGQPINGHDVAEFLQRPNLSSGLVGQVAACANDSAPIAVPLKSLRQVLDAHKVSGEYSLICDIEGGEIPLIEDKEALRHCSQMLIELHEPELTGQNVTPAEMLDTLFDQGFVHQGQSGNVHYLCRQYAPR